VVLIVDNYDSFVHNLARYVRRLGHDTRVVRNDAIGDPAAAVDGVSHIILSPGPCTPAEAGGSCALVTRHGSRVPVLGVCLGHQCIAAAYGGLVTRARRPLHGKASEIEHDGGGIFAGLPSPLRVGRYHSLAVCPEDVPAELEIAAWSAEGEVMALRHREHPVWGVQFHPESVLTEHGEALLANFLALERRG
jgi:para-aminobenzoate synthetase component II